MHRDQISTRLCLAQGIESYLRRLWKRSWWCEPAPTHRTRAQHRNHSQGKIIDASLRQHSRTTTPELTLELKVLTIVGSVRALLCSMQLVLHCAHVAHETTATLYDFLCLSTPHSKYHTCTTSLLTTAYVCCRILVRSVQAIAGAPVPSALVEQLTQERDRILLSDMREHAPSYRKVLGGGFKASRYKHQRAQGAHSPTRQALHEQRAQPRRPKTSSHRHKQQLSSAKTSSRLKRCTPPGATQRLSHGRCDTSSVEELLECFSVDELSAGRVELQNYTCHTQRAAQVTLVCTSPEQSPASHPWYSSETPSSQRPSSASITSSPNAATCWPTGSFRPSSATVRESATAPWNIPPRPRSAIDPRTRASHEVQARSSGCTRPMTAHVSLSFNNSRSGSFNRRTQPQAPQRSPSLGRPWSAQQGAQHRFAPGQDMNAHQRPTTSRPFSHVPPTQHTGLRSRATHSAPPQRTHVKASGAPSRPASSMDSAMHASAVCITADEHKDFCPSYTLAFGLGMVNRSYTGCGATNPQRRVLQECVPSSESDFLAMSLSYKVVAEQSPLYQ